ncbi:retropepsin-like aspartic protease family protein [Nitrincola iocasae]|jgi:aspartyl protease family protein|uniref:TIGR02281 family clan AA aspartic protease n=1 Tax=Nitrincola iocasae TaxID=2614693 RepID=A0A5J6LC41_9GAMM|nr:TIGR02281 family clan AA aspartic protease [Nitrincola iocasae]QEW06157.1 TIGR02281 family clan AA aspartic protease [Nitrincola iocasae]
MRHPDQTRHTIARLFQVAFWLLLLLAFALYFSGYLERRDHPNQHLALVQADGPAEVVLQRNRSGHYIAPGLINGHPVVFLLDTGATTISVPETVARQVQLQPGRSNRVTTASGVIDVYQTELKTVQLGNIRLENVQAHINPHMPSDLVLLGMSFMKNLEMTQRDGTLTLRIP